MPVFWLTSQNGGHMLNIFDLHDLYLIFTNIRNEPALTLNRNVLNGVLHVLRERNGSDGMNQFRTELQKINLRDRPEYSFISTLNDYSYIPFLIKDEVIYDLLEECCRALWGAVSESNAQKIGDLADALHNLPILLAENNLCIPRTYWQYDVKYYRGKWDASFLTSYEKLIAKPKTIQK